MMRRRTVLLLVLASMIVSSLITWIASVQIRSPAEVAARTAAPEPTPILVKVEEKVLATKVVTRGTGHYRTPRQLAVTGSLLKSAPQIVTSVPSVGTEVTETDVLLTISGRPVFLLYGPQPSYRDLGPGMSGTDVMQLERALRRAGFTPGRVDGNYDNATEASVHALYSRHGFAAFVADDAQLAEARPPETGLLAGGEAGAGVQIPSDEVIFVPQARLRVSDVLVRPGETPGGAALMMVTSAQVVVDGLLTNDQAQLVRPGAEAILDEPSLGIQAAGTVTHVATRPGTGGTDTFHVAFRVSVDDPPVALVGSSVRITVPIKSTGEARLTVPVSALSLGPDGGSRVRLSVDGEMSYVTVQPGLAADGYVVVIPEEGSLEAGDTVVIGFETRGRAGG